MYKGIYIALSGATLKQAQMDIISQNLANANTVGYKRDRISFREYLLSQMNGRVESPDGRSMSYFGQETTDLTQGGLVHTGGTFDLAIEGAGYLSLEDGSYTRRGDLRLDSEGYLVNHRGAKVLGDGGPIQIPDNARLIEISNAGEISVDGEVVNTLKVVGFGEDAQMSKTGEDAFAANREGAALENVSLKQGYLEKSNVDAVREMVQMITSLREFEAYQKAIQSFDESTSRAVNEIARL